MMKKMISSKVVRVHRMILAIRVVKCGSIHLSLSMMSPFTSIHPLVFSSQPPYCPSPDASSNKILLACLQFLLYFSFLFPSDIILCVIVAKVLKSPRHPCPSIPRTLCTLSSLLRYLHIRLLLPFPSLPSSSIIQFSIF